MTVSPVDIIILSNGPGEITTWVRPVVKALREQLGNDRDSVRMSVILSPCPNATGKETAIAQSYPEVDRVQPPEHFFDFLLWGKTQANWEWRDCGAIVFLGGDQAFAAIIGKRLRYKTIVYAEWDARWYRWIDRFCVRQPSLLAKIPAPYRPKATVVGDLMADVVEIRSQESEVRSQESGVRSQESGVRSQKSGVRSQESLGGSSVDRNFITSNFPPSPASPASPAPPAPPALPALPIALLPGSKAAKLTQGLPLCLAIAQSIQAQRPQARFLIPVAPTLDLPTLASYADRDRNPIVAKVGGVGARLIASDTSAYPRLETDAGTQVELITQFPAHEFLAQCCLALTTVGANTAELGALGIPMLVLLPTQQLDAMRSWDGIPGILANLPGLGTAFAKAINWFVLKQGCLFAWPNKWAGEEIVPELVGELQAAEVARLVLDYLDHPGKLAQMRDRLLAVRGQSGASQRIAAIVAEQLNLMS